MIVVNTEVIAYIHVSSAQTKGSSVDSKLIGFLDVELLEKTYIFCVHVSNNCYAD